MDPIKVLIADDHAMFREALRMLLTQESGIQVVGEATQGDEALSMAEALEPDILLLDIRMPKVDGLTVLPRSGKRVQGRRS